MKVRPAGPWRAGCCQSSLLLYYLVKRESPDLSGMSCSAHLRCGSVGPGCQTIYSSSCFSCLCSPRPPVGRVSPGPCESHSAPDPGWALFGAETSLLLCGPSHLPPPHPVPSSLTAAPPHPHRRLQVGRRAHVPSSVLVRPWTSEPAPEARGSLQSPSVEEMGLIAPPALPPSSDPKAPSRGVVPHHVSKGEIPHGGWRVGYPFPWGALEGCTHRLRGPNP